MSFYCCPQIVDYEDINKLSEYITCSASAKRRCQMLWGLVVPTVLGIPTESIRDLAFLYSLIACRCKHFGEQQYFDHTNTNSSWPWHHSPLARERGSTYTACNGLVLEV